MDTIVPKKQSQLPNTPTATVRQRWMDLIELSYSTRRITEQEIEPGVHAVIVPAVYSTETRKDLVEIEVRAAASRVPGMARGVRLALERLGEFALSLPADCREWMGVRGYDIARGDTRVTAFVDLAYLEAALLDRLWESGVLVDFNSPLAFFRRGALTDYANVYDAVVAMVLQGHSLAGTAEELAPKILKRLQLYANAYHQLSSLYSDAAWHIDHDTFVVKFPGRHATLSLQYWELRGDGASIQNAMQGWRGRIEHLLRQSMRVADHGFPESFAA
jgi:hypothetical protein